MNNMKRCKKCKADISGNKVRYFQRSEEVCKKCYSKDEKK